MAGSGHYSVKSINPKIQSKYPIIDYLLNRERVDPDNIYLVEYDITQPSGATFIEIREGMTVALDGTTTAVLLDIVSADAKDTAAGVGARTVMIVGISGTTSDPDDAIPYCEEVTLLGATIVNTARYYVRVFGMYVITAGSEGNAAGAITLTEAAGTTHLYCTIAAGSDGACNARVYVPDGYKLYLLDLEAWVVQTADANKGLFTDGANFMLQDGGNDAALFAVNPHDVHSIMALAESKYDHNNEEVIGDDEKFLTIYHQSIDTSVTTLVIHYALKGILVKI